MTRKSLAGRIKSLIYPVAFILIIILSVIYKLVFKSAGGITIQAFKSKSTAVTVAESSFVQVTDNGMTGTGDNENLTQSLPVTTAKVISVYICGQVNRPGIYEADQGVLLYELIEEAGGLTDEASEDNINFVYRIENNMSIYIPSEDEIVSGFIGGDIIRPDGVYVWGASSGADRASGSEEQLMVNINTASEEELKKLPGIGDVTAKAITDYRRDNPFKTIEDIKNVTGIGESKYNRIKPYICV